jgi:hypothetical protein
MNSESIDELPVNAAAINLMTAIPMFALNATQVAILGFCSIIN